MQEFLTSSGILKVDLAALAANYHQFQQIVGENCTVAGIVKANAYGIGIEQVVKTLAKEGCPQFFVATLEEALTFRKFDPTSPIAILGGLFTGAEEVYIQKNITPVLNTPDDIVRWKKQGHDNNIALPAFIHFDTGMNRLGLNYDEAEELFDKPDSLKGIDVQLIMSHFVAADDWAENLAKDLTKGQGHEFADIAVRFPKAKKSLANSSGVFRDNKFHHDVVRPGYAMYGGNPTPETDNPMQSVLSLKTRILQVRQCNKNQTIGYAASYKFKEDTRTATIALGYADGFLRSNSNNAVVYFQNQPCPVIGRVSMDLVTIDISSIKGPQPIQGDEIEILGSNQSVDDLAKSADTIGYEILTSLGSRYKREYIGGTNI